MRRTLRLVLVVFALVALAAATSSAAFAFNRAAAAAYADTYWQRYNPAWPSFAKKGGDLHELRVAGAVRRGHRDAAVTPL